MECIVDVPLPAAQVVYMQFNPLRDRHLMPQVVSCYQRVFAAEPWGEWKKCQTCGKKWGIEQQSEVEQLGHQHCGQPMVDFWPSETVAEDITRDIIPGASCWIALTKGGVVGFIWGFPITPAALEQKLKLPGLADRIGEMFDGIKLVAYQSELGVLPEYRKQGIAKELVYKRLRDFKQQGLQVGVVRTKTLPPSVTYLWFSSPGHDYKTVAEYRDEDGRVVLAREFKDYFIR